MERENNMKQLFKYLMAVAMTTSMCLPVSTTFAQTAPAIVGSWTLVSLTVQRSGNAFEILGPHPQGQLIFGSDGRYVLVGIRADLPKFESDNQLSGTPEQNKAIVAGSVAHFGTYTVDETGRAIIFHIQKSSFANWDGDVQTRPFTLVGDRLTYITPGVFGYGAATVVWQRAK
jgi:hypothetical protein